MLSNWIRPGFFYWAVFGFYALILLIPESFGLFAAILVALSLVVVAWRRPLVFPPQDRLFACFLAAFPLLMVPSLLVKGGDWDAFDYPVRALLFIPLIAGLRNFVDAAKFELYLYRGSAAGGLAAAVFSLVSVLHSPGVRVGLPITNPIAFGQIAAILAIISLSGFLKSGGGRVGYLFIAGFLGAGLALFASGSGGSLLGLVSGISLELILLLRPSRPGYLGRALIFVLLVAAIGLAPLFAAKFGQVVNDVSAAMAGHGMGTSQGQRLIMWGLSINSFLLNPWLGVGPGNGFHVIDEYCGQNACTADFAGFRGVHSQYLDVLMNSGVIGLLGWLIFAVGVLALFWSRLSHGENAGAAATGIAVCAAMLISALTQGLYHHNISVIAFFFTITFLWFASTKPDREQPDSREQPGS